MQRYATLSDLPDTLPVFPLVGALLLPRATLPLQIFEPRYLAMIDDCLRGHRLIGIIQPVGEGGRTGSPEPRSKLKAVGCAGRLKQYQELDDGRLMIGLSGVARFRPLDEVTLDKSYRSFRVDYRDFAHDLTPSHGGEDVDRPRLIETLKRYLPTRGMQADWGKIEKTETEDLVNSLAMGSPFGAEERQALIEASSLKERAEHLVTLAEMEIAGGTSGDRMQ